MFVRMTVRIPVDPDNFLPWVHTMQIEHLYHGDESDPAKKKIIDDFFEAHNTVALAISEDPGFVCHQVFVDHPNVYSCTVWDDKNDFDEFNAYHSAIITAMLDTRDEFLATKNIHVLEPVLFTIDNIQDLNLDLVREKHLEFIQQP